jgi:hypothetical protein
MKLEKLSPDQEQKMFEIKQYWMDYIFSCRESINRPKADMSIEWIYKLAGRERPIIIYLNSPMACQYGAHWLKQVFKMPQVGAQVGDQVGDQVRAQVGAQVWAQVGDQVRAQVGDQVWAQVRAQVGDQVGAQVGDQVRAQVRAQVGDQVGAQVWDQVGAQVRAQVGAQVGAQVWDQVGAQVRAQVGDQVGAQVWDQVGAQVRAQVGAQVRAQVGAQVGAQVWDQVGAQVRAQVGDQVGAQVWDQVGAQVRAQVGAQKMEFQYFCDYGSIRNYGWVSFFDFFTQIGIIDHKGFNDFKSLLQCGIYDMIQLNGFCLVSELPTSIKRNAQNRLHCEDGPAITFQDGYSQYYWKGLSISDWWITDKSKITKDVIMKETNAEKRRCLRDIVGPDKYFELLGGVIVVDKDIDDQGHEMVLYKSKLKDDVINKYVQYLKVICPSTDREYILYPPNQVSKNVWEAKASTFNNEKVQVRHGDVSLLNLNKSFDKPILES